MFHNELTGQLSLSWWKRKTYINECIVLLFCWGRHSNHSERRNSEKEHLHFCIVLFSFIAQVESFPVFSCCIFLDIVLRSSMKSLLLICASWSRFRYLVQWELSGLGGIYFALLDKSMALILLSTAANTKQSAHEACFSPVKVPLFKNKNCVNEGTTNLLILWQW